MTDEPPARFPPDLPLELDASARRLADGRLLMGGDPVRVLRLSDAGARAVDRMGTAPDPALARRLLDAGLAHPRPRARATADVTVVVPVRDRPAELDACLAGAGAGAAVVVVDDGSRDEDAVRRVCDRHGARLVRRAVPGGPAAARNAALAEVHTPLIAFLDSDCIAPPGWLDALSGHFADPLVAAVAPRVRGETGSPGAGPVRRFSAARSPVDLGARPAPVRPGGRVTYVPTAALLVRRAALGTGFDEGLRFGEDVDLVWRLHDAGWRVRYDPSVIVAHREPTRWRELVRRRFRYGTSAAALARRHPERLAPFVVHPWSLTVSVLLLARRPRTAALVAAVQSASVVRRLRPLGVPSWRAAAWPLDGARQTALAAGRTTTMLAPGALLLAAATRRGRVPALALATASPLAEWLGRRPRLDPLRWTALVIADDVAYGAGVWWGCARRRTLTPLRPVRAQQPTRGFRPASGRIRRTPA